MRDDQWLFVGPRSDPNRYRVGEVVGTGGEGEVRRGEVLVEGRPVPVAVKRWRPLSGDPDVLRRQGDQWANQVRLVQSIEHPAVVRDRESFIGAPPHRAHLTDGAGDVLYLVMNWAEGVPLYRWACERPRVTYADVCAVVRAVAGAVAHLHSGRDTGGQPILHCDLKPDNVIISGDDRVHLVDFGHARGSERPAGAAGTPGFRAPEVARSGGTVSKAADIFSLGALTYFLVTGRCPPERRGGHDPAVIVDVLARAPMISDRPGAAAHIAWAMAPRPDDRPVSATAWAAGLRLRGPSTLVPVRTGRPGRSLCLL
jgi:serine/threonine protein kinase